MTSFHSIFLGGPYAETLLFFAINIIIAGSLFAIYLSLQSPAVRTILRLLQIEKYVFCKGISLDHVRYILLVASVTFTWYSISLSLTVYNKWILQVFLGGFDFPMTSTLTHMTLKYLFSQLYVRVFLPDRIKPMPASTFWLTAAPIGIFTALDIGFSNEAITRISLSLYTIVKSTLIGWTFVWGCVFGLEKFSVPKLCCVLIIMAGLSLSVLADLSASTLGLLFCIGAAASGGLRWVLVQVLQESDENNRHPVVSMYQFAGATVIACTPLVFFFEYEDLTTSSFFTSEHALIDIVGLLLIGGTLSFLLLIVEIYLLSLTSSLSLSILGEMKEAVQIIFAMLVFGDHFTVQTGLGIFVMILAAEIYRHLQNHEYHINNIRNERENRGKDHIIVKGDRTYHSVSNSDYDINFQPPTTLDIDEDAYDDL